MRPLLDEDLPSVRVRPRAAQGHRGPLGHVGLVGSASTQGASSISPVPGFMSSWDSRSPTSAAVAEELSVPIPPQPFSVDVEAGPPTFSGTSLRLLDAKQARPPHWPGCYR